MSGKKRGLPALNLKGVTSFFSDMGTIQEKLCRILYDMDTSMNKRRD